MLLFIILPFLYRLVSSPNEIRATPLPWFVAHETMIHRSVSLATNRGEGIVLHKPGIGGWLLIFFFLPV